MKPVDEYSSSKEEDIPTVAPLDEIDDPTVPDPSIRRNLVPTWDGDLDEYIPEEDFEQELNVEDVLVQNLNPTREQPARISKKLAKGKFSGQTLIYKPIKSKRQTRKAQSLI